MELNTNLEYLRFGELDLSDPFFDSLKEGYAEFETWFKRKSEEKAFVIFDSERSIQGFLYLKVEQGPIDDVEPILSEQQYIKIGTFKINGHGTKLGERFLKKAFDFSVKENITSLYVTVFPQHESLIRQLVRFGFNLHGTKAGNNGVENVYVKTIGENLSDSAERYFPAIKLSGKQYLLAIYPAYHTRLFPDSILNNESASIVEDVSHTNSIEKIYICKMPRVSSLNPGDLLLIYRTGDGAGPAEYRSVATSICMVEEMRDKSSFKDANDFLSYALSRSVFSEDELTEFYSTWKHMYVIKMTYNAALQNRMIRNRLIEEFGLERSDYWGFMSITKTQLRNIARAGNVNESIIVD